MAKVAQSWKISSFLKKYQRSLFLNFSNHNEKLRNWDFALFFRGQDIIENIFQYTLLVSDSEWQKTWA